jgi:excisionase family DNA binding protein
VNAPKPAAHLHQLGGGDAPDRGGHAARPSQGERVTDEERAELKAIVAEAVAEALATHCPAPPKKSRAGLLTLQQAGELLGGTSPGTIRNWIWQGRIKSYKPGKHPLVRETELLAFVEANESRAKRVARKRAAAEGAAIQATRRDPA